MSRSRRAAGAVLPGVAGALALLTVSGEGAVAQPTARPADGSASVSAALEVHGATPWYAGGQFVVTNTGGAPTDWSLSFRVTGGTFQQWADWAVDTERDDDLVRLSSKSGHDLGAGQTIAVSFGISGDGSVTPSIEECDVDGSAVDGCSLPAGPD